MTHKSKSLSPLSQKSATICRRKQRLSQKSATVAEFRRCLAVFGDSRTFLRQCGQSLRLRLPPQLYFVTALPSKTCTTANIDDTFSNV